MHKVLKTGSSASKLCHSKCRIILPHVQFDYNMTIRIMSKKRFVNGHDLSNFSWILVIRKFCLIKCHLLNNTDPFKPFQCMPVIVFLDYVRNMRIINLINGHNIRVEHICLPVYFSIPRFHVYRFVLSVFSSTRNSKGINSLANR